MRQHLAALRLLVALGLWTALLPQAAVAQSIATDGTVGPKVTLTGPSYTIGASLGKVVGANLFQSFLKFGLISGESASFSGAEGIADIIARVTGGSPSKISGAITSSVSLFLINPFGIVFGPGATVNVAGSFHAATAGYVKMSDGSIFSASHPQNSSFSAAPPAAFGFLNARPPAIRVEGGTITAQGTLALIGGPVMITGGTLSAPAGTIDIASAAGTGEIPVNPLHGPSPTVTAYGPVSISKGAVLDVTSGGSVFLRAGTVSIDASQIHADDTGEGKGGEIVVNAGALSITDGGQITAGSSGSGAAGNIVVNVAGTLSIQGSASSSTGIFSDATGAGAAGRIAVAAGELTIDGSIQAVQTGIISEAAAHSAADAGAIFVTAGTLSIANAGQITSDTLGKGDAGSVSVTVTGGLTIVGLVGPNGGANLNLSTGIFSRAEKGSKGNAGTVDINAGSLSLDANGAVSTASFGRGNAGDVTVSVAGLLSIDGGVSSEFLTGISSVAHKQSRSGGDVNVTAGSLSILDNGEITTSAMGGGEAGNISVAVSGPLTIDGSGQTKPTGIVSEAAADSTADAGAIFVTAGTLSIANAGQITSDTLGKGDAGSVSVTVTGGLTIVGLVGPDGGANLSLSTGIFSRAQKGSKGNAGTVDINAGSLSLDGNGAVSTASFGRGNAGDVTVSVAGLLSIDGGVSSEFLTGISSVAHKQSMTAGNVRVTAGSLSILDNGEITTDAMGGGEAGNISVSVSGALTIDGSGQTKPTGIISNADAGGTADAGSVTVSAGAIAIFGGGTISSSAQGSGIGGDVQVTAGTVTLSGPGSQIAAQSDGIGDAGSINVRTGQLEILYGASISTEGAAAKGGNITLSVGNLLYLSDGEITASSGGSGVSSDGGNITIDPRLVVLTNGSRIKANAFGGNGGNISISASAYIASPDSTVTASSQKGISGTITISGQLVGLNGILVALPGALLNAEAILRNSCAARRALPQSSFVDAGRGGLPEDPGAVLPALYLAPHAAMPAAGGAPPEVGLGFGTGLPAFFGCG